MAKQIKTNVTVGEEYEFLDTNGKHLFSIRINPADVGIVKRVNDIVDFLNSLDMSEVPENTDQAEVNEVKEMAAIIENTEKILAEKLDQLFDSNISEAIFSVMNPFTPLKSGKIYIEEIVDNLCNVIEEELNQRTNRIQNRMSKYTAKYRK